MAPHPTQVVATPGRLWELLSGGHTDYLADLSGLRYLVLDEADRMIETGHFAELNLIVDAVLRGTGSGAQAPMRRLRLR